MKFCTVAFETHAPNVMSVWAGRAVVLFSYTTPVAAWVRDEEGNLARFETTDAPTTTTRRHLNKYGPGAHLRDGQTVEKVSAERLIEIINAACPR